ncbi:MAG: hypothetical protein ACRD2L_07285, partial [Terriglobia bacterium]
GQGVPGEGTPAQWSRPDSIEMRRPATSAGCLLEISLDRVLLQFVLRGQALKPSISPVRVIRPFH